LYYFSGHRPGVGQPAQLKPPLLPQLELLDTLAPRLLKDATIDKRLLVFFEWHPGHSGELILGSENPINFSNSLPQSLH
jgi:hypothetical protein